MTTSHTAAAELLEHSPTIAVVGFSTNPGKAAHRAPMLLVERGWDVIPIHPTASEVAGLPAVASLADVARPIDLVDVFRPSAETPEIAEAAVAAGAQALWLQLGITSPEARAIAEGAGLEYIEDLCAGALAERLDLHPAAAGTNA